MFRSWRLKTFFDTATRIWIIPNHKTWWFVTELPTKVNSILFWMTWKTTLMTLSLNLMLNDKVLQMNDNAWKFQVFLLVQRIIEDQSTQHSKRSWSPCLTLFGRGLSLFNIQKKNQKNVAGGSLQEKTRKILISRKWIFSYYKKLWSKYKKLWDAKYILLFWVSISSIRVRLKNKFVSITTYDCNLANFLPDNPLIDNYWGDPLHSSCSSLPLCYQSQL